MMEVVWQIIIGILGVIVTVLLPLLAVLSKHGERLAAIESKVRSIADNWQRCNAEDRAQHADMYEHLHKHGEQLANHEARLERLESEI